MTDFEVIDKHCAVISEQAEIIRKQALLLELMQSDSEELAKQRASVEKEATEAIGG